MEPPGTNHPFQFWVEVSEERENNVFFLQGVPIDDNEELLTADPEPLPRPYGIVTPTEKKIVPLQILEAHNRLRGPGLCVAGLPPRMAPPYLITNLLDTQAVEDLEVEMTLTPTAETLFARDWHTRVYPVKTEEWFGILTRRSGRRVHLRAFSRRADARVRRGQTVVFAEWDGKDAAGVIESAR